MATWIEIEKEDLVKAIKVLEMIPMRSGTPSSDYIRILPTPKYLEMAMSSSVSAVLRVNCKGELGKGPYWIDRRLIVPFVLTGEKWKGGFSLAVEEGVVIIKQGSRRAELFLRSDSVDGYGTWRDLKGMKDLKMTEDLKELLLASNNCSTADPALQHLMCVYVKGNQIFATNQTVMFAGTSTDKSKVNIPFPIGIIPLLSQGLVEGVIIENNLVILDCGCGYIQGTVSAAAEKNFPRASIVTQMQRARKLPTIGKIPTIRLTKMLKRLSDYLVGMKREDWQLKLEFGEGKLKAVVKVRQGSFEEKMDVENLKKEAEVEWPLELVRPVLEYIGKNSDSGYLKVQVDEAKRTPYLLSGGGVALLVARRTKK